MDLNLQKQEFSFAYVHAVCASAGFIMELKRVDIDSVDAHIFSTRAFHRSSPGLGIQLKCSGTKALGMKKKGADVSGDFPFVLSRKNYDDLRDPQVFMPRILVVVHVPDGCGGWLKQSEKTAIMRHCGYWHSLVNAPDPADPAQKNVTVRVQRTQLFTVAALASIMHTISKGGRP